MYRIALVNMPFASAALPSIALTQLRAAVESRLGDQATCELFYLSHDTAGFLGPALYNAIADSVEAVTSGLGDWFFKPVAFPASPDDARTYLNRHFSQQHREMNAARPVLLSRRREAGAFLDRLVDRYRLDQFQLVGFTSNFSQNVACFAMARKLKARNPNLVTVMGGANCETSMGRMLAKNAEPIDFVCSGPALKSFPELIGHLLRGDDEKCHQVQGIYSKTKLAAAGAPLPAAPAGRRADEVGEELDIDVELPLAYDDFLDSLDTKLPRGTLEPKLLFETSRGCWWGERSHCTFCGLNGLSMGYRGMRPELALRTIQDLFARYGHRVSSFQAVDNIMPRQYLSEVFPHLTPPAKASLFYEVKADLKDAELATLARAGVTEIQPGIEALATSTLKLMRKGTTSFQNLRFLKGCVTHGIRPAWNLLIGFPGEEEAVYEKYHRDLPHLVHLPPPSGVFPVRFDRFSPYHAHAAEYELRLEACDFYSMIYPFAGQDLEEMAYYFTDRKYDAPYVKSTATWLSRLQERIQHWHARWFGSDGKLAPRLQLMVAGDERAVYDSRSGAAVRHALDATDAALLELLAVQRKPDSLAAKLGGISPGELAGRLAALEQAGMLFRDGDLVMSLLAGEQVAAAAAEPAPCYPARRETLLA
ncbi:MAG TPA: RiPP maturation radical SAM C-methyltransferase [Thermoanaerobaculia bacterium]|nr:RiPP maturation radical SAM C-methyltransferase [Thermoanaerobaculia bacterium]